MRGRCAGRRAARRGVRRRGARRRGRAGPARPPAAQCGAGSGGGGRAGSRAAAAGPSAAAGGAGVWQERVATAMGGPWRPSGVEYFNGCMRRAQPKSGRAVVGWRAAAHRARVCRERARGASGLDLPGAALTKKENKNDVDPRELSVWTSTRI